MLILSKTSELVVCRWHGRRRAHGEVPRDTRCYGISGARREAEVLCADPALVGRHVQRLDGVDRWHSVTSLLPAAWPMAAYP